MLARKTIRRAVDGLMVGAPSSPSRGLHKVEYGSEKNKTPVVTRENPSTIQGMLGASGRSQNDLFWSPPRNTKAAADKMHPIEN